MGHISVIKSSHNRLCWKQRRGKQNRAGGAWGAEGGAWSAKSRELTVIGGSKVVWSYFPSTRAKGQITREEEPDWIPTKVTPVCLYCLLGRRLVGCRSGWVAVLMESAPFPAVEACPWVWRRLWDLVGWLWRTLFWRPGFRCWNPLPPTCYVAGDSLFGVVERQYRSRPGTPYSGAWHSETHPMSSTASRCGFDSWWLSWLDLDIQLPRLGLAAAQPGLV